MRGSESQDGMVRIHAAVPYVSTLQHVSYPHVIQLVNRGFTDKIENAMVTLPLEFDVGRHYGSKRMLTVDVAQVINPKLEETGIALHPHYLRRASDTLMKELHLERISEFLFSLQDQVELLQIFTDVPNIPWDWFYSASEDKFLCEVFGLGMTLPEERRLSNVLYSRRDRSLSLGELASSRCSALLVNSRNVGGEAPLLEMDETIGSAFDKVRRTFGARFTFVPSNVTVRDLRETIRGHAEDLRLIVLNGHFGEAGFLCDDVYFSASDLRHALDETKAQAFQEHPVVILNGCVSKGRGVGPGLGSNFEWNRSLAQEFLECGAAACVFTSAKVRLKFAERLLERLLSDLLEPGVTLGSALLAARRSLRRDECYEWATYHLLGDPTYVMVREGEETYA